MSPGFCPGSKGLKSPTPEYVNCPQCGYEVEIWTHELMRHCPQCQTPVMRPQKVSCLDWCNYAKECVGPQLYAKLKTVQADSRERGPIQVLTRQHDEAIKRLGVLKGATLCLRAGTRSPDTAVTQTLAQAARNLGEALQFFDGELRDHFQKEEEGLFPVLHERLAKDGSPISQMLAEHQGIWQKIDRLGKAVESIPAGAQGLTPGAADDIEQAAIEVIRLLRAHIEKENTMLFPLATANLSGQEMEQVKQTWASLKSAFVVG